MLPLLVFLHAVSTPMAVPPAVGTAVAVAVRPPRIAPAVRRQFAPWVPRGWKLLQVVQGDLNRDGAPDAVVVLEETDPGKMIPNEGMGPTRINVNPRRLRVLLRTGSRYRQVAQDDELIPSEAPDGNACVADPLAEGGSVVVRQQRLRVQFHYWQSCGSGGVSKITYTFRVEGRSQAEQVRLIGYDHWSTHRYAPNGHELRSVNLLTGRIKTEQVEWPDDRKAPLPPQVEWTAPVRMVPVYLGEDHVSCEGEHTGGWSWCR